jgi:Cu/Zn superoxide dismutase
MISAGKIALATTLAFAVSGAALAAPNAVNHMTNAMSVHAQTINMGAQNGSKQDGQAWLKDTPGGLWVKIMVHNEPRGASEPAHIHTGKCEHLNPAPAKGLSNVVNGTSVTTLKGVTLAWVKKGHYAINVHQSTKNLKHYVSCGDL